MLSASTRCHDLSVSRQITAAPQKQTRFTLSHRKASRCTARHTSGELATTLILIPAQRLGLALGRLWE